MKIMNGKLLKRICALLVVLVFCCADVSVAQLATLEKDYAQETIAPENINEFGVRAVAETLTEFVNMRDADLDAVVAHLTIYIQGVLSNEKSTDFGQSQAELKSMLGSDAAVQRLAAVIIESLATPNMELLARIRTFEYRYSPEGMAASIQDFLDDDQRIEVNKLLDDYARAKANNDAAAMAAVGKKMDPIINDVNSRFIYSQKDSLTIAQTPSVESINAKAGDLRRAVDGLKKGELILSMPFSGAGSRMQKSLENLGIDLPEDRYRLATFDVWNIAIEMGKKIAEEITNGKDVLVVMQAAGVVPSDADRAKDEDAFLRAKATYVDPVVNAVQQGTSLEEALAIVGFITQQPIYAQNMGLAERHMIALEQGILNLKNIPGVTDADIKEIFRNMKIVVSISALIETDVRDAFTTPSKLTGNLFFSLNPNNVVFMRDANTPGFQVDSEGVVTPIPDSTMQWSHGYGFVGLTWQRSPDAFTLTADNIVEGLQKPFLQYMQDRGAQYGCVHRINDMLLLNPSEAIDVGMFNAFLYSAEQDEDLDIMFQMMANPTGQKGGMALSTDADGKYLRLVEGLATKDAGKEIAATMDELSARRLKETNGKQGVPYNRLYGYYKLGSTFDKVMENDLPLSLKYKNGILAPEVPTGDVTWVKGVNAVAVVKETDPYIEKNVVDNPISKDGKPLYVSGEGSFIHDIKQTSNLIEAVRIADALDNPVSGYFERKLLPAPTLERMYSNETMGQRIDGFADDELKGLVKKAKEVDTKNRAHLAANPKTLSRSVVTIDGDPASGKSTHGKALANRLGFAYMSLGTIARAVTAIAQESEVDVADTTGHRDVMLQEIASKITLKKDKNKEIDGGLEQVFVEFEGEIIDPRTLNTPEIAAAVASFGDHAIIHNFIVDSAREFGLANDVVIDGRMAGTAIFPEAEVQKYYVTAQLTELARRRLADYENQGIEKTFEEVKTEIQDRLKNTKMAATPDDAVTIDTTAMQMDTVVGHMIENGSFAIQLLDLENQIESKIDSLNSREMLERVDTLQVAPFEYIEDVNAQDEDWTAAREALLNGELFMQNPFSGLGSRMQKSLVKRGINLPDKDYRLANLDVKQIAEAMGISVADYVQNIGLAERHMLALEQGIYNLQKKFNYTDEELSQVFKNMKLVVSISNEIEDEIRGMFTSPSKISGRKFFGLDAKNVVFMRDVQTSGFTVDEDQTVKPIDGSIMQWSHGYGFVGMMWKKGVGDFATEEGNKENEAFTIDENNAMEYGLDKAVLEYMKERGAEYGCIHRINDLILTHPEGAVDAEMLNAFLVSRLKDPNVNMFFEMMDNPKNQKGGLALSTDGQYLRLVEGLAAKDEEGLVAEKIEEVADAFATKMEAETGSKKGVPYNRLYGHYSIADMLRIFTTQDLPLSIKFKNNSEPMLAPEVPTGDVTWVPGVNAKAVVRRNDKFYNEGILTDADELYQEGEGAFIHDIKQDSNVADGAKVLDALDTPGGLIEYGKTQEEITTQITDAIVSDLDSEKKMSLIITEDVAKSLNAILVGDDEALQKTLVDYVSMIKGQVDREGAAGNLAVFIQTDDDAELQELISLFDLNDIKYFGSSDIDNIWGFATTHATDFINVRFLGRTDEIAQYSGDDTYKEALFFPTRGEEPVDIEKSEVFLLPHVFQDIETIGSTKHLKDLGNMIVLDTQYLESIGFDLKNLTKELTKHLRDALDRVALERQIQIAA